MQLNTLKSLASRVPGLRRVYHRLRRSPARNRFTRQITGSSNRIDHAGANLNQVVFDIAGNNNRITIGEGCTLNSVRFYLRGDNHRVRIGRECRFSSGGTLWLEDDSCALEIGEQSSFVDVHLAVTEPGRRIMIGSDCMFAYDIDVRTGDSHAIFDASSRKRINPAADVRIGDHVWVAAHSTILKGAAVESGSIVATGSIVTGRFSEPGIIVGGNPARTLRRDVIWSRNRSQPPDNRL